MRGLTHAAQSSVLIVLCLAAAPATGPATTPTARAAAQQAIDEMLAVLRDPARSAGERARGVKESAARHLDFDTFARLSLGPAYRTLPAAQQAEFTAELRKHILFIASRSVSKYDGEEVTVLSDRPEANGDSTVLTRITRKKTPSGAIGEEVAKLDFRLRQIEGRWRAIDIIIKNISLAGTFRAQFDAVARDGGIERVIQLLREKNVASERAENFPPEKKPTEKK